MDNHQFLMRIADKVEEIDKNLHHIDKTLTRNTDALEEHIKRTAVLESKTELIDTHIDNVKGAAKFVTILSVTLGVVASIFGLWTTIK